ncbi:MmcQ/YjbR family DNA-binding protein [Cellulomonas alba]|uniref:MmcQ/YjbR family DNA-binding protein n=1 Tax=Cellulomonas alba TaxID=3053467 RepID=A0ABT7SK73_9CELL|nr:MmcQ/YjbR family DNA-binding protein [Cellulomonas alba]MDM7856578.1 MmcQ/YjbR family DNA-binding protein [Cellulomonas alba]
MATWDDVRAVVAALPDTDEPSEHAWKVHGRSLAWERPLRRADHEALGDAAPTGDILGVRTAGLDAKDALLASSPQVFFTTPHFDGYPAVLVRLAEIGSDELTEVVVEAWLHQAPKRVSAAWLTEHPDALP